MATRVSGPRPRPALAAPVPGTAPRIGIPTGSERAASCLRERAASAQGLRDLAHTIGSDGVVLALDDPVARDHAAHGVDAYEPSPQVDHQPARMAGVDRGNRLDHVRVARDVERRLPVGAARDRDDAGRRGQRDEARGVGGIPECHHRLAVAQTRLLAQGQRLREACARDTQDGERSSQGATATGTASKSPVSVATRKLVAPLTTCALVTTKTARPIQHPASFRLRLRRPRRERSPPWRRLSRWASSSARSAPGRLARPSGKSCTRAAEGRPGAPACWLPSRSTGGDGCTLRASACSSVEERRPSKPRVGGSNPSRRASPWTTRALAADVRR